MPTLRKQAGVSTIAVMGSRVAGLFREVVFAFFFGAGPALDAFIAAFRIPNLLRDLFSEGALSTSFVTVFSKKREKEGDQAAWNLANRLFLFVGIFLGCITLFGILFSPTLVKMIASGFDGEKFYFTVQLNRLLFPFILFVSFSAIAMGMLNTLGKFALPHSASTFFNLTSVLVGLVSAYILAPQVIHAPLLRFMGHPIIYSPTWHEGARAMIGMALGTLVGGLVQWIVQMPSLFRMGFKFQGASPFIDSGLKQVLKLTGPAIIGGAAVQVNVLINTNFASYLTDGSMAWLNYAFRLMQFPIGVFGVAIASVTTPALSRLAAVHDTAQMKKTLRESAGLALFLCIPSALGLIFLAKPIVALIYEYGRFTGADTLFTSQALMAYASGLSFYALIKILQPAFLAFDDAKTPMVISFFSIVINVVLNGLFTFVFHFQHWGLALGTSMVSVWNCLMLLFLLRKKLTGIWDASFLREVVKIILSSILSMMVGFLLYRGLLFFTEPYGFINKALLVFFPIGIVVLLYYFICLRLHVTEVMPFKQWMKNRRKK